MLPASRGRIHKGALLALLGFLAAACAPLELGPRGTDTRTYGRCGVTTLIDQQNGETSHTLTCLGFVDDSPGTERPAVGLNCLPDASLVLVLQAGEEQSHRGQFINVRYRFNQRETVGKAWLWEQEKQMAGTLSDVLIKDVLRGMAAGERLTFEVGDRWATIPFTGDTPSAIRDFQSRCAALGK